MSKLNRTNDDINCCFPKKISKIMMQRLAEIIFQLTFNTITKRRKRIFKERNYFYVRSQKS